MNTNRVLEVSEVVWDIIHYYGRLSPPQMTEKFKGKYDSRVIHEGLEDIESAKAEGVFSNMRPERIDYPRDRTEIIDLLETELRSLTLGVTEDCNMRCKYCVYGGNYRMVRSHSRKRMSFRVAQQAIDYFLAHSVDICGEHRISIGFYGGEPLLNFDLIKQCVAYLREVIPELPVEGIDYHITTNGTCFADEIIDFLIENEFLVLVTLDGPQSRHDTNRVFRNNTGTFDHIITSLRRFQTRNPDYYRFQVNFITIVTPVTPPVDLMEIYDFFTSTEILGEHASLVVSSVSPGGKYLERFTPAQLTDAAGEQKLWQIYSDMVLSRRVKDPLFLWEAAFPTYLFGSALLLICKRPFYDHFTQSHHSGGVCLPGHRKLFVSTEGRFYLCERVNYTDSDEDLFCIGNVEHGLNYGKILRLIDEYGSVIQEDCCRCWANRLCPMCFAMITPDEQQQLSARGKRAGCQRTRATVHDALVRYYSVLEQDPHAFDFMEEVSLE